MGFVYQEDFGPLSMIGLKGFSPLVGELKPCTLCVITE